jgi:GNAT superfamily N-acetyltransferase
MFVREAKIRSFKLELHVRVYITMRMHVYIYAYIYTHTCIHVCVTGKRGLNDLCCADQHCVYMYTYSHMHIQVEPLEAGEAEIGMFSVDPDQQSQGIGRKLLEHAESYAREKLGAKKTVMHVIDIRDDLLTWYVHMGYVKTGVKVPFPVGANCGDPKMPLQFERIEKKQ